MVKRTQTQYDDDVVGTLKKLGYTISREDLYIIGVKAIDSQNRFRVLVELDGGKVVKDSIFRIEKEVGSGFYVLRTRRVVDVRDEFMLIRDSMYDRCQKKVVR